MSGRPRANELESRNAKLLDAATKVFLQAGYDGASMSAIARQGGASLETLYARYPTKAELFAALIERKSSRLFDAIGPLSAERGHRETLLRFAVELLAMMMKRETQELHRLVVAESLSFPELGEAFWKAGPGRGLAAINSYLEQQRARGVFPVADVERAAEVFLGILVGGITLRTTLGLRSPLRSKQAQLKWAEHSVDLFLAAYR